MNNGPPPPPLLYGIYGVYDFVLASYRPLSWPDRGTMLLLFSFLFKVGRASLKLNAGSAGECQCEWMKRDVSMFQTFFNSTGQLRSFVDFCINHVAVCICPNRKLCFSSV